MPSSEYTLGGNRFLKGLQPMAGKDPSEGNVQTSFSVWNEATKTLERKIGGTTYIMTGKFKESGENLLDKLWRLIENDEGDDAV